MKKEVPAEPIGGGDGPKGLIKEDLNEIDDLLSEEEKEVEKIEDLLQDIILEFGHISLLTQLMVKAIIHKELHPYLAELHQDPHLPAPQNVLTALEEIAQAVG